jgi:hypothetical protein
MTAEAMKLDMITDEALLLFSDANAFSISAFVVRSTYGAVWYADLSMRLASLSREHVCPDSMADAKPDYAKKI